MGTYLETLARGDLDAESAEKKIAQHFQEGGSVADVYNSLATLLWHVVSERRKDADLRKWHGLMLDVAFRARKANHVDLSERIKALTDVLRVSVAMSDRLTVAEVLRRAHVPALLAALGAAENGRLSRSELQARVGLQSANLSRLLTLVTLSGLAEREQAGKEAFFVLTETGKRHLATRPKTNVEGTMPSQRDHVTLEDLIQEFTATIGTVERQIAKPAVRFCRAPLLTIKTEQPQHHADFKRVPPKPEYTSPTGIQLWPPVEGIDVGRGKQRVSG